MPTTMIKKLLKYLTILGIVMLLVVLFDLKAMRGYSLSYLNYLNEGRGDIEAPKTLIYEVQQISKERYKLTFKNHSFIPYYFWSYRNDKLFQEVTDTLFFNYATRRQIHNNKYAKDYTHGVDCGTGIGCTSINPFEKFELEMSRDDFLKKMSWEVRLLNYKNGAAYDIIYNEKLFKDKHSLELNKDLKLTEQDSIEIACYLPLFTYYKQNLFFVSSNPIKVSYLDLINAEIEERNRY